MRRQYCVVLLVAVALVLALSLPALAVPAFPGAEGYGKNALGGRGGAVIQVTSLADTGTGTLRAALTATGPRTVVFRVAGIIELASDLVIVSPYVTIAGQTAPGDGICLKFARRSKTRTAIDIRTHDVVIRYLRIRCGFSNAAMDYGSAIRLDAGNSYNIMLDHLSMSWHPGRTGLTIWPDPNLTVTDLTVQRSIASEALLGGNYPGGARGAHLFGSQVTTGGTVPDGYVDRISLYKTLMAHNKKRHPESKNCQLDTSWYITDYQLVNNVIYHFDNDGMFLEGNENDDVTYHIPDTEACHYNVIGNYFKRSLIPDPLQSEVTLTPGARLYVGDYTYGNIGPSRPSSAQDPWDIVSFMNPNCPSPCEEYLHAPAVPYQALTPFDAANLPPYVTADAAYTDVLNDVGANMGLNADGTFRDEKDAVDIRVINDVINNTGSFINDPTEVGGWPTYGAGSGAYPDTDADGMSDTWEMAKFGTLSRNGAGDYDGDGYTDLEEFLNGTEPVGPPQPPVADFSGNPTSGNAPLTVAFTDLSSGNPTSWSWTFGDTGTSTAQNPSHQYTSAGTYTVALTVTNAQGSDTETKANYIAVSQGGGAGDYLCASATIAIGTLISGDHSSLHASDNTYMVVGAVKVGNRYHTDVNYTFNTSLGSLSSLSYTVECNISTGSTTVYIYAWNYTTSVWDQVGTGPVNTSDTTATGSISSPANYISGGTVKLRTDILKTATFNNSLDLVKITAAP